MFKTNKNEPYSYNTGIEPYEFDNNSVQIVVVWAVVWAVVYISFVEHIVGDNKCVASVAVCYIVMEGLDILAPVLLME